MTNNIYNPYLIREDEKLKGLTEPYVSIQNLTKIFGPSCPMCIEQTGPEHETNKCCTCGSIVALRKISIELYPNEILGIIGESGSGKSTLVRLLHFDMDVTYGEMYLDPLILCQEVIDHTKKDIFTLSAFEKRKIRNKLIGIVYQNPYMGLKMDISCGGNIAEKLIEYGWRNVNAIRTRAMELLNRTEVPIDRIDHSPKTFSGGMQQRVQIAKALSTNPKILLLDEVTTGLDLSVQAKVLDLIKKIQEKLKITMIVVSHDLGVIRLLATRTVVMKYGTIVEAGLTDQILEDPQHPYTQLLVNSQL
ncbi:MAG: ATP-binding cassette domain-containing protein [Syntrophorhabdaceae bacterium]|nr:ATP-binding cassette domain-containing protein [Syntrophorhabdaceae bacterium]